MLRFTVFLLAVSGTLCLMVLGSALAAEYQRGSQRVAPEPNFATGDIQNAEICQKGEYLVGFTGRVGQLLDRIGIRCAPVLASGAMGKAHGTKGSGLGGGGGGPVTSDCANGGVINHISFSSTADQRKITVIRGVCVDPVSGEQLRVVQLGGHGEGDSYAHECYGGNVATGLAVNWGHEVNAIGLICDPLAIPTAAQPCPDGQFRLNGVCQTPQVLEGSTTGADGGFIQMFPTTPESGKPPLKVNNGKDAAADTGKGLRNGGGKASGGVVDVSAANDTTIYDTPDGSDVAYLSAGDPVTIVKCNPRNWCQISAPEDGWVWGDDLNR